MNEKLFKIALPVCLILILLFYWFQLRPSNIKKECWRMTEKVSDNNEITKLLDEKYGIIHKNKDEVDYLYNNCLREKGL